MTATAITSLGEDTEVTEKAKRRSFTVQYKRYGLCWPFKMPFAIVATVFAAISALYEMRFRVPSM
jgi:hypothetical protein